MEPVQAVIAGAVAASTAAFIAWLNRRMGLDTATARYIASLEGLVKARDEEIADLKQEVADLQLENRNLRRNLQDIARRLERLEHPGMS